MDVILLELSSKIVVVLISLANGEGVYEFVIVDDVADSIELDIDSLVLCWFIPVVLVTSLAAETIALVESSDSIDDIRSV